MNIIVYVNKKTNEAWPFQAVHADCQGQVVMEAEESVYLCTKCNEANPLIRMLMYPESQATFGDINGDPGKYRVEEWPLDKASPLFES